MIQIGVVVAAHSQHFSGKLFILVGPAGSGKNTLMKAAVETMTLLHQIPTATTRSMREGEQEGREHFYVTHPEFERMIERGDLLEYQLVHGGNYYGMMRRPIEEALMNGELLIADIEYLGAQAARAAYPDNVVTVFVTPPTVTDLINRLCKRGEPFTEIAKRLLRAPRELAYAPQCDYIILNADQDIASGQLIEAITAEMRGEHADIERSYELALRLASQVMVTAGDSMLQPLTGELPYVLLDENELPHQAAHRALSDLFGEFASTLFRPFTDLAPTDLRTEGRLNDEILIYVYAVHLPETLPAPDGWAWLSVETQFA